MESADFVVFRCLRLLHSPVPIGEPTITESNSLVPKRRASDLVLMSEVEAMQPLRNTGHEKSRSGDYFAEKGSTPSLVNRPVA